MGTTNANYYMYHFTFLTDIEMIIEKYTAKKTSSQNLPGSEVDNNLEGDDDAGEDKDDFRDEDQQFENAKRKLRLVLCQADFQNLPLLHPDNRVAEKTYANHILTCNNYIAIIFTTYSVVYMYVPFL